MKVSTYLREWLRGKAPDLRRSTYEAYTIYIEKQIAPYFDELGRELEDLRPLDVHGYVVAKRNGGRKDGKPGGLDTTMNIYVAYSRTRPLALGGTLCGLFADSPEKKRGR